MTPATDAYRAELLRLADEVHALTGLSDPGISRAVFGGDKRFIRRLRDGENFTIEKGQRLEAFLREHIAAMRADAA
ncbi:hypothetical protein [Microvirga massiliensis]|uniref:hypothetical protein n=1 Tax=Microvirga massiliensis TaxID=1033741 RepID=UPI00062B727A|nr:hypothetical protein [Microvirga massiliensis]